MTSAGKDRDPVAQLVEHRAVMREVAGSNPDLINTQDLKITEEKVLPLLFHLQMVRPSMFISSPKDVKERTHTLFVKSGC